ncbi:heterokaryon incompatibility protein-domain-containing protein [Cercophora scortea]|uniref:Heterokaryon incompatibility protein-domain-containing protein n=1 Tax=Cercophora scortea TaxID=314031 RepID=A0AAE0IV16_9PEZI|nr:heterokaryon incompatibility protein-domain-containing protein [Cercophora scortea]
MAAAPPTYQYERMTRLDQVRVLHLTPGAIDDAVSGTLQLVQLGDVSYEALSYEWGQPEKSHAFHLEDGRIIHITESLHNALRDLRHLAGDRSRTVWADGICINQDDAQEVAQQVGIMGNVYRTASRVVTYVGPEKEGSAMAIEFASTFFKLAVPPDGKGAEATLERTIIKKTDLPPVSDPRWLALRPAGAGAPTSSLLNDNLTMMCVRTELPHWLLLPSMAELVFNRKLPAYALAGPSDDPNDVAECISHLKNMRLLITRTKSHKFDLSTLLQRSHPFRASNPRDKI